MTDQHTQANGPPASDRWQRHYEAAAALLARNRAAGDTFRYTRPCVGAGPPEYENQFLWDSCMHAIIWRWIDPEMAQDELLTLLSTQLVDGPDAGMIPHITHWGVGDGIMPDLWPEPTRSSLTQPPLIAVAAQRVYETSGDTDWLQALYLPLSGYHAWLDRRRDPDGDNLVTVIHPWETGWDGSPRWDGPLGLDAPTYHEARRARHALASRLIKTGYNAADLTGPDWFSVEPVDFNAIRVADLEALAWMAETINRPDGAAYWRARAAAVRRAVRDKMCQDTWPVDLHDVDELPLTQPTAAQYVTLFGGCATDELAARLVERLQSAPYWTAYPVPSTPTNDPTFNPSTYWRGNVWPPVNWLIVMGLRRYGYDEAAATLVARTIDLVEAAGFWEYYDPLIGAGLGAVSQSWAALSLDLLALPESLPGGTGQSGEQA